MSVGGDFIWEDQMLPPLDVDFINEINRNIEEVNEDVIGFFEKNLKFIENIDITQLMNGVDMTQLY